MPDEQATVEAPDPAKDYLQSRFPGTDIDSQRASAFKRSDEIATTLEGNIRDIAKKRDALINQPIPHPKLGKLNELPNPQTINYREPFQVFQNPAVLLATLGSLMTRAPLTTAMNAGAAAMEAQKKGDDKLFEQQTQIWEEATKKAQEQNKNELEKYHALWNDAKLSMEEKMAKIQGLAASFKDEITLAANAEGQVDRFHKILDAKQKAGEQIELALIRSRNMRAKMDQKSEEQKARVDTIVNQIDQAMSIIQEAGKKGKSVAGLGGTMNRYGELVLPGGTEANEFEQLITTIKMGLPPVIRGSTRALGADKGELDKMVPGLTPFKDSKITYNELAKLKQILTKAKAADNSSPLSGLSDEELRQKAIEAGIDPDSL